MGKGGQRKTNKGGGGCMTSASGNCEQTFHCRQKKKKKHQKSGKGRNGE